MDGEIGATSYVFRYDNNDVYNRDLDIQSCNHCVGSWIVVYVQALNNCMMAVIVSRQEHIVTMCALLTPPSQKSEKKKYLSQEKRSVIS